MKPGRKPLTKTDFEALSEFRYQIRRFERFSEDVVQADGITPLQYLLLLHIKGYPGRVFATVGELAQRLQAKPHGVVALSRAARSTVSSSGARARSTSGSVEIHLLPDGERVLAPPGRAAPHRAAVAGQRVRRSQHQPLKARP